MMEPSVALASDLPLSRFAAGSQEGAFIPSDYQGRLNIRELNCESYWIMELEFHDRDHGTRVRRKRNPGSTLDPVLILRYTEQITLVSEWVF